jgi:thiamine-phosphate pyrophosphorylase
MSFAFPKIYPILDSSCLPAVGRAEFLRTLGESLSLAGVTLMEYRNKSGTDDEILSDAAVLRVAMPSKKIKLILDDRVKLLEQTAFDGVHVDLGDMAPAQARRMLGPGRIVGTFGGGDALVPGILEEPADYFSVGPVYPTMTKQTTKASIGPEGVKLLRKQAGSGAVLVAVGGIKFETAAVVLAAGANTVAVSAAIFRTTHPAAEFRRWMEALG